MVFWFAFSFEWGGTLGVLEYFLLLGWRTWCILYMGLCICYMRWSIWYFGWIIFITKLARIAFIFGLNKLCSKQSLSRSLWKKVHRLEKSTPTPWVAWLTNIKYDATKIKMQPGSRCIFSTFLSFSTFLNFSMKWKTMKRRVSSHRLNAGFAQFTMV